MSIKGTFQELFVGTTNSNIIGPFGGKKKIEYASLSSIEYFYATSIRCGFLCFKNGKNRMRFEFSAHSNEKISRAIDLISENAPNLAIVKHDIYTERFYQKPWFAIAMLLFCCFPFGLYLLWYYKKPLFSVRLSITVIISIFWIGGLYSYYMVYTATLNQITSAFSSTYDPPQADTVESSSTIIPDSGENTYNTIFKAGTYKVGDDIPSGEYVLFNDDALISYLQIAKDSTGALDSIIANDTFMHNSIVSLNTGQYFALQGAYAVPITEATTLDTSETGMFKIGKHLDSGEYMLQHSNDDSLFGYYEVTDSSDHTLDTIVTNGTFENFTYITVEDGQYLKISNCYINFE